MSRLSKKLASQSAALHEVHNGMRLMTARVASMEATVTGLRIGSATIPRQRIEITDDALRIQTALLDKRINDAGHRALNYVLGFCGLFVAIGMWQGWI